MASLPGYQSAFGEWWKNHCKGKHKSCIKINGCPILPPLMTEDIKAEMRFFKGKALEVEKRLSLKRVGNDPDDTAGGEALYEGASDEFHFSTTISVNGNVECHQLSDESEAAVLDCRKEDSVHPRVTRDMLKEFDPLAPGLDVNSSLCMPSSPYKEHTENLVVGHEGSDSKTSSANTSASLCNSTDLNQYMDVTESSIWGAKSAAESTSTISSILQDFDSSCRNDKSKLDGRTTYEDLNNYLDIILNNGDSASLAESSRDKKSFTIEDQTELDNSSKCKSLTHCPSGISNFLPEPLTELSDSLTSPYSSQYAMPTTPYKNKEEARNESSSFLHECSLSPVLQDHALKSLEGAQSTESDKSPPQGSVSAVEEDFKSMLNPLKNKEVENSNVSDAPPRLVRSNSYTLDSPSPLLLAHMEAELQKSSSVKPANDRTKALSQDRSRSSLSCGRSRRIWDVEKAKNTTTWYNKQNSLPNNQLKRESGSQTPRKVQIHNNVGYTDPVRASSCVSTSETLSSQPIIVGPALSKFPNISSEHKDQPVSKQNCINVLSNIPTISPLEKSDKENLSFILAKLQLQHTKEMEALVNKQRKEQEAIKLVLLKELEGEATRARRETPMSSQHLSSFTENSDIPTRLSLDESPSKEKTYYMMRRNTSPSIHNYINGMELALIQSNKSSSVSVDNVGLDNANGHEVDPDRESRFFGKVSCVPKPFPPQPSTQSSNCLPLNHVDQENNDNVTLNRIASCSSSASFSTWPKTEHLNGCSIIDISAQMMSSFPVSQSPNNLQNENMVSSLPSGFDIQIDFPFEVTGEPRISSTNMSSSVNSVVKPHQMSHPTETSVQDPSRINKRRSWCSRQLFNTDSRVEAHHCDWVEESLELQKDTAAAKIQAGVRGYLTRRLLKTERVQNCITTIRDTIVCALQLQKDCTPHVEASDLQLHGRLIQQLSAACEDLHNIFLGLPISKRLAIISADRMRLLTRSSRPSSSAGSRPLSRATQIVLQRKLNLTDPIEMSSACSTSSSYRSRRRSWAVDSRVRTGLWSSYPTTAPTPSSAPNVCEVISGCLSRSSAPMGHILQRSASAGSSRQPWR